jgi:hypothetical protein
MEDLWRVRSSAVDIKDLADLAEYHRFLERFRHGDADNHKNRLLYGDARFGSPDKGDQGG